MSKQQYTDRPTWAGQEQRQPTTALVTRSTILWIVDQKLGITERVFANPNDEPVYVRVRMGLFGMRAVRIPVQFVETDETRINHRPEIGAP